MVHTPIWKINAPRIGRLLQGSGGNNHVWNHHLTFNPTSNFWYPYFVVSTPNQAEFWVCSSRTFGGWKCCNQWSALYFPFIYLHSTWLAEIQPAINSTSFWGTYAPLQTKKHSHTLRHAMSCALGRGIGNGGVDTRKAGRCFFTTPPSHCATVMPLVRDHFMELMNRGMRTSRQERAKAIANQKIAPTKKYIHQAIPIAIPKLPLPERAGPTVRPE